MDIAVSRESMVYAYRMKRRVMKGPILYGARYETAVGIMEVYFN